jgi:hypothetical protein
MALLACACSVYDPALLSAPAAGTGGPTPVTGGMGGAGGMGANEGCGDGIVGGAEKCDTAIATGQFGACPTSCPASADPCVPQGLVGTGCDVACAPLPAPACGGADGCCPATCTPLNDADCSIDCGDGMVDMAKGETCEPGSAQDCPMSCDDMDDCTTDAMTGSRQNCNVLCTNTPVTGFADDGCCPTGASAGDDPDCGNTPEQDECLALVAAGDACAECACLSCTSLSMACFGGSDATRNAQCEAVVECARDNSCKGNDCYCGTNLATCATAPEGPCASEITTAAGGMAMVSAQACAMGNALGDAIALGNCADTNCAAECPARTGTVQPCM